MLPLRFSCGYWRKISKLPLEGVHPEKCDSGLKVGEPHSFVELDRLRLSHGFVPDGRYKSSTRQAASSKSWLADLDRNAPSSADAGTASGSSKPLRMFSLADLMPERCELHTLASFYNMHCKGRSSVAQGFMSRLRINDS